VFESISQVVQMGPPLFFVCAAVALVALLYLARNRKTPNARARQVEALQQAVLHAAVEKRAPRGSAPPRARPAAQRQTSADRNQLVEYLLDRTETRSFGIHEGDFLWRLVARHPGDPIFLRAAGVYEVMHGDPAVASRLFRDALRCEAGAVFGGRPGALELQGESVGTGAEVAIQ